MNASGNLCHYAMGGEFTEPTGKERPMTSYYWGNVLECVHMSGLTELVPNPSYLQ